MLSEHRDEVAATAFFKQAIDHNQLPVHQQFIALAV
jgi:transposase-like protein